MIRSLKERLFMHSIFRSRSYTQACFLDWCFYNILMSLLQFCFKIHGFLRNFQIEIYPRIEPRIQSQPTSTLLLISPHHKLWVPATLDSFLPCVTRGPGVHPPGPLVTLPGLLLLPVKPYPSFMALIKPVSSSKPIFTLSQNPQFFLFK